MADPKIQIELIDTTTGGTVPGFAGGDDAPQEQAAKRRTAQRENRTAQLGGVAAEAVSASRGARTEKIQEAILLDADKAASAAEPTARAGGVGGVVGGLALGSDVGRIFSDLRRGRAVQAAKVLQGTAGRVEAARAATGLARIPQAVKAVATAAGPIGIAIAAVTASAAVVAAGVKIGLDIAEKKAGQLAFASPEIQIARARVEVADIQSRIRQAEALGPVLGGIETARGGIGRDIEEITSVIMQPFLDVLKDLLEVVQTFTRPLSNFFEEHRDLIAKVIKFFFNVIAPMTKVIEWWAEWAGGGQVEEFGDPIAEMLAIVQGQPIDPAWGGREVDARGANAPGGVDNRLGRNILAGIPTGAATRAALAGLGLQ